MRHFNRNLFRLRRGIEDADLAGGAAIDIGACATTSRGVRLTPYDLNHHLLVAGATGSGKTKLLEHVCRRIVVNRSLSPANGGLVVVDPHAAFARSLIEYMATLRIDVPLVVIDHDADDIVAFDPLWDAESDEADLFGTWIAHLWERQGNSQAPRLSGGVTRVTRALREARATLAEAYDLLNPVGADHELRHALVRRIGDPALRKQWESYLDARVRLFDFEMGSTQRAFAPLVDGFTERLACGLAASFRFEQALAGAWIVLIVGGRARGSLAQVTLMLDALWHAVIHRTGRHPPMHLFVDEFTEVLSPAVPPLLPQARKFGLSVTLGMQSPSDLSAFGPFGRQSFNAILHSARTKIAFQLDGAGARVLSEPLRIDPRQIAGMPRRHAVLRSMTTHEPKVFVTDDVPDFRPSPDQVRSYMSERSRPWRGRFLWSRDEAIAKFRARRTELLAGCRALVADEPDEFGVTLDALETP